MPTLPPPLFRCSTAQAETLLTLALISLTFPQQLKHTPIRLGSKAKPVTHSDGFLKTGPTLLLQAKLMCPGPLPSMVPIDNPAVPLEAA